MAYRGSDRPGAQLVVRRSLVERFGARGPLQAAQNTQAVKVGDTIRTDKVGEARVDYFDGSVTRVDSGTAFKVIDLVDRRDRKTIAGKITGGRITNEVQAVRGSRDRFEIRTPHAWIVAEDAVNVIDCRATPSCTVIGITDVTEITIDGGKEHLLEAGECLTIDGEGEAHACKYPKRQLCSDEFTLAVLERAGVVSQCADATGTSKPVLPLPGRPQLRKAPAASSAPDQAASTLRPTDAVPGR